MRPPPVSSEKGRPLNPTDLLEHALVSVDQRTSFPTVDELNERMVAIATEHPDISTVRRIGTSRLGEPLSTLTVGDGGAHAVVFGGVHPNEPVGGLTALHLADQLTTDASLRTALGYTWHIIPCIDPDGTRLNEGWFGGPFTRSHYGRNFYRPAPDEQVEWTFPFAYKRAYFDRMMPETVALMRLIDDTRPAFMCSLHNGEFGGVYYYLSRRSPELYGDLQSIPARLDLPLDTGEPEAPYVENFAPGIFGMIRSEDKYDFTEEAGLDPTSRAGGASSAAYAAKYGTLTLVSEVPYWTTANASDNSQASVSYAQALSDRASGLRGMASFLDDVLRAADPDLSVESPFLRASRAFIPILLDSADLEDARADREDPERSATVAEAFGCADLVHCFRLRYGGMLLRALESELAVGNGTPIVRYQHRRLLDVYTSWAADAERVTPHQAIPIQKLVAVQFSAIVVTAEQALAHPTQPSAAG